jgi:hypothetical protein
VESNVDIARPERAVVGLFRAFDGEGNGMWKRLGEALQRLRCYVRVVGDLGDWHSVTVVRRTQQRRAALGAT